MLFSQNAFFSHRLLSDVLWLWRRFDNIYDVRYLLRPFYTFPVVHFGFVRKAAILVPVDIMRKLTSQRVEGVLAGKGRLRSRECLATTVKGESRVQ